MLTQDNFTKENIERLQKISGNDPSLLEKTVYAFGLLEAISKVGIPDLLSNCLMIANENTSFVVMSKAFWLGSEQ